MMAVKLNNIYNRHLLNKVLQKKILIHFLYYLNWLKLLFIHLDIFGFILLLYYILVLAMHLISLAIVVFDCNT